MGSAITVVSEKRRLRILTKLNWDRPKRLAPEYKPAKFPARFKGQCPVCGHWFEKGTLLVRGTYALSGEFIHAEPKECWQA